MLRQPVHWRHLWEAARVTRIFWVTCPKCKDRFYCHYELRHGSWKLRCPYCEHEFDQDESPRIDE